MFRRRDAYDEEYKLRDDSEKDSKRMLTGFGIFFQVLAFVAFFMYMTAFDIPIYGRSLARIDYYIFTLETIPALIAYLIEAVWAIIKERNAFRIIKLIVVVICALVFSYVCTRTIFVYAVAWNVLAGILFVVECISFYRYKTYRELE